MLDCLILGDSLAVGIGQARPACTTMAKVGITSAAFLQALPPAAPREARTIVISLGVNDDASMATQDNLRRLRAGLRARRVVWLLPGLKDEVRRTILALAATWRDATIDTRPEAGPDHLHPPATGYRTIADQILPATTPTLAATQNPGAIPRIGQGFLRTPGLRAAYALWPPANTQFAAIPPPGYAYRALPLPLPAQATPPR